MGKVLFKRIEDSGNINNIEIEDGSFIVTGDGKIYVDYGEDRIPTSGTPDTEMSDRSRNTVENNVIKNYVDTKCQSNGKILWTNPNPSSSFIGQTITLSSSDYDVLEIYSTQTKSNTRLQVTKVIKGYDGVMFTIGDTGSSIRRTLTRVSDTSYTVGNVQGPQDISGNNDYVIPIYVIGYKTGLFS